MICRKMIFRVHFHSRYRVIRATPANEAQLKLLANLEESGNVSKKSIRGHLITVWEKWLHWFHRFIAQMFSFREKKGQWFNQGRKQCNKNSRMRMTEWENDRMTERQNDRLTEWQNDRMTEWQNDRMIEWQNDRMIEWQNDRVTEWQSDRVTEW